MREVTDFGWWDDARGALSPEELAAARAVVRRVRREVGADLVQASLFGSKARGEARPGSDIDLLLVFRRLPPDREPQAGHAEAIAEQIAEWSGIPVTVWSVALIDLELGNRTPMLVDALADSIPLWRAGAPLPVLDFTPADALRCVRALLQRLEEGADEFSARLLDGDAQGAARRARDDLVRLCTAVLLMRGITRPRHGDAVREFLRLGGGTPPPPWVLEVLHWAAASYGPRGKDEDAPVPPPPGGLRRAAAVVEALRLGVAFRAIRLRHRLQS